MVKPKIPEHHTRTIHHPIPNPAEHEQNKKQKIDGSSVFTAKVKLTEKSVHHSSSVI